MVISLEQGVNDLHMDGLSDVSVNPSTVASLKSRIVHLSVAIFLALSWKKRT